MALAGFICTPQEASAAEQAMLAAARALVAEFSHVRNNEALATELEQLNTAILAHTARFADPDFSLDTCARMTSAIDLHSKIHALAKKVSAATGRPNPVPRPPPKPTSIRTIIVVGVVGLVVVGLVGVLLLRR